MRTSERRHLKENELALVLAQVREWAGQNSQKVLAVGGTVVVLAVAVIGFMAWRSSVDTTARTLLAEAMVAYDARVTPPTPPADAGNATPAAPAQPPGTYPTQKAKLEAALPKFLAAADAHPSSDAGQTARFHAASVLVDLGRYDEALQHYTRLSSESSGLLGQMARMGRAEAELRASKYDQAIASFKELSERTDLTVPKEAMLMELARAYRLAGKTEDARKTLTEVVEQHAESPFATEAKQELEKLKG